MNLRQICIELDQPSEYKEIQLLLFSNGCKWNNGSDNCTELYRADSFIVPLKFPIWITVTKKGLMIFYNEKNYMTKSYPVTKAEIILRNFKMKKINAQ